MQIKMWFADGDRMFVQLGDNEKTRKNVSWEVLQKATEEEPFSFAYAEQVTSPMLGDPKMRRLNTPNDLTVSAVKPEGQRPMAEQDALFRKRQEEQAETERLDEEAEKDKARRAVENETAERTESERISRTKGLRDRVSEEQDQALDEQEQEDQEQDFPEDTGEEEQAQEEDVPAEEEVVEEEEPEPEPEPAPVRGRRGARAARR